jgi:hypothetical protein
VQFAIGMCSFEIRVCWLELGCTGWNWDVQVEIDVFMLEFLRQTRLSLEGLVCAGWNWSVQVEIDMCSLEFVRQTR